MRFFLLGIALLLAGAWAQCAAKPVGRRCAVEWDAAKYDPVEAKQFGAGSAVRVCTFDGAFSGAQFYTPVERSDAGVCFFWVDNVGEAVPKGRYPDRGLMMRLADGAACPRQDDPGYITNMTVPDGVFAALVARWNATGVSPGQGFVFPPLSESERSDEVAGLEAALSSPQGHARFTVVGVYNIPHLPDAEFPSKHGADAYELLVNDATDRSIAFRLTVDWSGDAFRVSKVDFHLVGG